MRCWQPPAHGSQGRHGACGGVRDGARGRVQPGSDRGVWQGQVSRRCPRTPLVQPHLSAPRHSVLQRNPAPARRQPPRGSFTPAPSPAWRTRTAWERRSAARWAVVLPAWSRCRVRPPRGRLGARQKETPSSPRHGRGAPPCCRHLPPPRHHGLLGWPHAASPTPAAPGSCQRNPTLGRGCWAPGVCGPR